MTDDTIDFTVTLTITEQKDDCDLYKYASYTSIGIIFTEKKYSSAHVSLFLFQIIIRSKSMDCGANQWTAFYIITASFMKGLKIHILHL